MQKKQKKKNSRYNEIIDISTTNANFLKILFSAFAQKNGERNAVTGSTTYKNRKSEKSQHNAWDALSDFFSKIRICILKEMGTETGRIELSPDIHFRHVG